MVAADAGPAADADDACKPKSAGELALENCGSRVCGTIDVTDNCGVARTISCGACANGLPCKSAGTGGCAAETQAQLVNLHCGVGACGDKSVTDRCGAQPTVSCGRTCAGQGETCGGGDPRTTNVCACTPESAAQFCARYAKNCSTFFGPDNCAVRRTNVACGPCTLPQTYGGVGTAGVCGCTPTTCAAQGKHCGSIPEKCGGTLHCIGRKRIDLLVSWPWVDEHGKKQLQREAIELKVWRTGARIRSRRATSKSTRTLRASASRRACSCSSISARRR